MEYTLFTNKFGGLNTYLDPEQVGPEGAVDSVSVDLTQGPLQGRLADKAINETAVLPAASKTIFPYSNGALGMSERYAVAMWGSRLYRSHKGFGGWASTDITCIQYTNSVEPAAISNPQWDCLGLSKPANPLTASGPFAGGSLAVDTYTYVVTFYNALGHESVPSQASNAITTTSGNGTISLTNIPIYYANITTYSGQANATVAVSVLENHIRVGMRIVGVNIPSNTYVLSVDQSTGAVVLSQNATAGGTAGFRDEQLTGRKIYRSSIQSQTYQFIAQIADMSTTTLSGDDNGLTAQDAIGTEFNSAIPAFVRDIAISPGGIMTFVQPDGNIAYLSLASTGLYRPDRVIKPPDSPMVSIYALGRFIFPCKRGAFALSIEDVTGIPIISMIDADEASEGSLNVYALDTGSQVWWNTNKGIMSTDGLSIKPVTRYTHSLDRNRSMRNCYGMLYFNGDVYIYTDLNQLRTSAVIYVFNQNTGWSEAQSFATASAGRFGTIGSELGTGNIVYTKDPAVGSVYYELSSDTSRVFYFTYRTGEWVGEKVSQLKKFRKIAFAYSGSGGFVVYVDGTTVHADSLSNSANITRQSFWLPSGTKGRTISVRVNGNATTVVDEISLWVGEQRGPMP